MNTADLAYLNGDYLPLAEARVPVLDRGFLFGDGVYEVVPVYGGHPLRLAHHLGRLQQSLDAIRIANPLKETEWQAVIERIVEAHGPGDQSLYIQVTRGVAPRDHAFPEGTPATVLVMSSPLVCPSREVAEQGLTAITLPDIRWLNCHIKAITLLPNVLFRQQALDAGVDDAILVRDDLATEGTASNVFAVIDGIIVTPPKGRMLLPGITRDLLVELAAQHQLPCQERDIPAAELAGAEEIWLSSSVREVAPVVQLDGVPVGTGRAGPVWTQMYELFQALKQDLREGKVS